jgi:ABC-type phosphate transport system substrate-binding protein
MIAAALVVLRAHAATPPPPYQVIVDRKSDLTAVDRRFLADAFLKKVTTWPDGRTIHVADLPSTSATRRRFTAEVLRRSVEAVKGYWQQRIFSGRDVPPPELDTDEDMKSYVLKHDGAVGYVSGEANIDGVKVVSVN